MYISDKTFRILDALLLSPQYITSDTLSKRLDMSPRTVRVYLKELKGMLEPLGIVLISKPGVGIRIAADQTQRQQLRQTLRYSIPARSFETPEERCGYIIQTLLRSRDFYTTQLLADDLYVSKRLIAKDLAAAAVWFKKYNLELVKKTNLGLKVGGDEFDIRQALVAVSRQMAEKHAFEEETPPVKPDAAKLDYRFGRSKYDALAAFYRDTDIAAIQEILQNAEAILDYRLTGESFVDIVSYLVILIDRLKIDKRIRTELQQLSKIRGKPEYDAAVWISGQLAVRLRIAIPAVEIYYIAICLLGADVQRFAGEIEASYERLEKEYIEIAQEAVKLISYVLSIDLQNDPILLKGLSLHLKLAIFRVQYNVVSKNPLLTEIKEKYSSIYCACWIINCILVQKSGLMFSEDEISKVALYICGAVVRQNSKLSALLVCADGLGTAQLIAGRIEKEIGKITISAIVSAYGLSESMMKDADMVITTVNLPQTEAKVVRISERLDESDWKSIRKCAQNVLKINGEDMDSRRFSEKLSEKIVLLDGDFRLKEDVIRFGSGVLRERGFVSGEFCEDVLKRESITSTSMGNGVALPHGIFENVLVTGICLVRLNKPVNWSGDLVDIVFILALRFSDIQETSDFFRYFYSILNDPRVLNAVRIAGSAEEIERIILGAQEEENNVF